jgi:hypothetical protein
MQPPGGSIQLWQLSMVTWLSMPHYLWLVLPARIAPGFHPGLSMLVPSVDDHNQSEGSQIVLRSALVSDEIGIRKWMHKQVR